MLGWWCSRNTSISHINFEAEMNKKNIDEDELITHTIVDREARAQIDQLRRRFEGAHLVPSFWTLVKQMFQSTIAWAGWEVFGLVSIIAGALFALAFFCIFSFKGCNSVSAEHDLQIFENQRRQYGPACESLHLVFTRVHDGKVVCAGENRVVTINTNDIDETETQFIEE